jgi:hypothetical protein
MGVPHFVHQGLNSFAYTTVHQDHILNVACGKNVHSLQHVNDPILVTMHKGIVTFYAAQLLYKL